MNVRDYPASLLRTVVPIAVGVALDWVARKTGVVVATDSVAPVVAALAASAYYAVVRLAERKWPKLGWLLGLPVTPSYIPPSPPSDGGK
jgi:hypothetical protein